MLSPASTSHSPSSPAVPKLKLNRLPEPLHLGDSMRIIAVNDQGYMAQINDSIQVLLLHSTSTSPRLHPRNNAAQQPISSPAHENHFMSSPNLITSPRSSQKGSRSPGMTRSNSLPSPSRCVEGLNLENLRLSPRLPSNSPPLSLTTLFPRAKRSKANASTRPTSPQSTPTSPRMSISPTPIAPQQVLIPSPSMQTESPKQRMLNLSASSTSSVKPPAVQRSPSYTYYPVQGWVLWRRSIGQWERVWLASKKSPTRICFFTTENEDSEERDSIRVGELRSLWAPEDESSKSRLSESIHFRLFTERKTIYLIVQTVEKMRYWIAGLRKLNPDMEIDVRGAADPASPISPRPSYMRMSGFTSESYDETDDESESWAD